MIGRVNAGGGGSLQATDAILRVIAPAGSTVTISKGGVSKSDLGHENAADTSLYDYYFIIHASQFDSVNPWTVTASLGAQSISDTIVVDSADEYDLTLLYTLYLIKNGASQVGSLTALALAPSGVTALAPDISYASTYIQIGWSSTGSERGGIVYVPVRVDLSKYSVINVDGTVQNHTNLAGNAALSGWTAFGSTQADNRVLNQALSNSTGSSSYVSFSDSIDVSNVTDFVYLGVNSFRNSSVYSVTRLKNLYLEV